MIGSSAMGLKENLLGAAKSAAAQAGKGIATGLNRADELGGDLRDYLLEKKDSPTLRKIGERMAKLGGLSVDGDDGPSPHEEAMAAAAAVAPPPTAAENSATDAAKGLGDPEIAAQIYGRDSCPWTGRAITLLNNAKVDFDYLQLDESENRHFENKLISETKQDTVPYVFLRGEFVGGYNELNEIVRVGRLDYRILSVDDKKAADASGKPSTTIAAR
ncbi:MAG: glutaredoxin [Kofleriaceae bacterium]|nr:glutaredoxin [Kofleriaceae bacterium]